MQVLSVPTLYGQLYLGVFWFKNSFSTVSSFTSPIMVLCCLNNLLIQSLHVLGSASQTVLSVSVAYIWLHSENHIIISQWRG